jgi:hypothetical protein
MAWSVVDTGESHPSAVPSDPGSCTPLAPDCLRVDELPAAVPPGIPGPWGEPPWVEEVKPLHRSGAVVHAVGAALNVLVTGRELALLTKNVKAVRGSWLSVIGGLTLGTFVADFVSGLLHWGFDTWFDDGVRPLTRMVYIVREHHLRPARIFRYRLRDEAGLLSWFGIGVAAPLYGAAHLRHEPATKQRLGLAAAGVTVATQVTLMLEFHKWGHRARRGRAVRLLQGAHLLLSPETHLRHHAGDHDSNYCLITGIADQTLGRIGMFRALEKLVTALTGAEPRRDDVKWAMRYGRPR